MRILWVFEVVDASGAFQPKIGLGSKDELDFWLNTWLSVNLDRKRDEWRVVQYVPSSSEMPNGSPSQVN